MHVLKVATIDKNTKDESRDNYHIAAVNGAAAEAIIKNKVREGFYYNGYFYFLKHVEVLRTKAMVMSA